MSRLDKQPPQLATSSMDGRVDDQDYYDGAQNDHPIGKLNARCRCLFAKPFHDYPPMWALQTYQLAGNLFKPRKTNVCRQSG